MKVLSLAHMCMVEIFTDQDGKIKNFFNGPSPDEVTLVEFAASKNFDCVSINDDELKLAMSSNKQKLTVFHVFRKMEFNSDRKRMSVLLKDPTDNKIKLFIKGADSIIKSRLD